MEYLTAIGNKLKEIRENKGIDLREVADITAINYSSLSRIETGKRLPTKAQIRILASFYNYSEKELLKQLIRDKIICEIKNEDFGLEGFYLAEQKIKYGNTLFNDYKNIDKIKFTKSKIYW
ncbi:helix-turn-helix domain-containing protein [Capnocytophaga canimorsus]|nr:helix-turn-helix transcriptional regulator [Capnocytophaga canimorsus]